MQGVCGAVSRRRRRASSLMQPALPTWAPAILLQERDGSIAAARVTGRLAGLSKRQAGHVCCVIRRLCGPLAVGTDTWGAKTAASSQKVWSRSRIHGYTAPRSLALAA